MTEPMQARLPVWRQELTRLGDMLATQIQQEDWSGIAVLDKRIARRLSQLRSEPALFKALTVELDYLQKQHQMALEGCRQALVALERTMSRFNAAREGVRMYEECQPC